jgi:hypothetical protein
MARRMLLALTTIALCLGTYTKAQADQTLKFRTFMHATSTQSQDVGDVDGHATSVVRFSGLAEFDGAGAGINYFVGTTDYTKGAGKFSVYNNLTLKDGSVLWYKAEGTAAIDGATTVFKGTITVLGGKGIYDGVKGEGLITGTRYTPLKIGADLFNDVTINLKK